MPDIPFNNKFLNPFIGGYRNKISPYGTGVPTQGTNTYNGLYNATGMRSLGIRTPVVYIGWGYDLQGRPVSNEYFKNQEGGIIGVNNVSYLKATNQAINHGGFYGDIGFSTVIGEALVPFGGAVSEPHYVAGPLDIRFDYYSGFWRSSDDAVTSVTVFNFQNDISMSFTSKVNTINWDGRTTTLSKNYFSNIYTSDGLNFESIPVPRYDNNFVRPSGFGLSNRAVNISEPFELRRFLPDGRDLRELVNVKSIRFSGSQDILHVFSRKSVPFHADFLAIITDSRSAGTNKWWYNWREIEFLNDRYVFKINGREGSNASNLQEYNNTFNSVGYGEDVTSNSEINIVVRPIQVGSIILIKLISYMDAGNIQQLREQFSTGPNPLDISCENTGACCSSSNSCSILSVEECHNLDGTYLGRRTLCSSSSSSESDLDCNLLTGACCKINGACVVTTSLRCLNLSGIFKGFGTDCDGSCNVAVGCCNGSFLSTPVQCAHLQGHYHGDGTDCSAFGVFAISHDMGPYMSYNSGVCCKNEPLQFFSFSPEEEPSIRFRCEALINPKTEDPLLPGYYVGDFTESTLKNYCSMRGACCIIGGECEDLFYAADCTSNIPGVQFGFFMGFDTMCKDVTCGQ